MGKIALCNANEEHDDVKSSATKIVQHYNQEYH